METSNLMMIPHPQVTATARDHLTDQKNMVSENLDTESQWIKRKKQTQKMTEKCLSTHPKPIWTNQIGTGSKPTMTISQDLKEIGLGTKFLTMKDRGMHMNGLTTTQGTTMLGIIIVQDINNQEMNIDIPNKSMVITKTIMTGMTNKTSTVITKAVRQVDQEII